MKTEPSAYHALLALNKAAYAIACERSLDGVLQQIVDSARELAQADYAALGVPDPEGGLEAFLVSGLSREDAGKIAHQPEGRGLLGALLHQPQSIRLDHLGDDPRSAGFPPGHPVMDSFLGVPILAGEIPLGNLYLANKPGAEPFSAEDQKLVEMLAGHATLAIQRARLRREEQAQSRELALRNRQLTALHRAAMSISRDLDLKKVLAHIVDVAHDLAHAEYAALGVPGKEGGLETFIHSGMPEEIVAAMSHAPQGVGLLGAIARERRPIRLAPIEADRRAVGFPLNHPKMRSFLGVPIMVRDEVLGNLYLTNKRGAEAFSETDQELVEMLASHAAIAIQNARLYEQVERLAVLEERTRIGMDLHDGVIQSIYAVGLTLESTKLSLPAESEEAAQLLDVAVAGLNDAIRDIRNFILDLRPRRFQGDLEQGLAQLVREFQANTMVPVTLHVPASLDDLPVPLARTLYLTTQEALANVARHAKASEVVVTVVCQPDEVILTVADNGQGFDLADQTRRVGHGLSNMQARADELRGTFAVRTRPGHGTSVVMRFPL